MAILQAKHPLNIQPTGNVQCMREWISKETLILSNAILHAICNYGWSAKEIFNIWIYIHGFKIELMIWFIIINALYDILKISKCIN
jgi:hypothetical protein